jgi:endonuclease YncB( thermonuclease family)
MLPGILQKTLLWSVFFVWAPFGVLAQADCPVSGAGEPVSVRQVIDGDTLILADGRRVRLIGVNTPEIGYRGQADQPHARLARQRLQQRLSGRAVTLVEGEQARDRYGRTLAHVLDPSGALLAEFLIAEGLGYALSVPPNTRLADCLFARERDARAASRGLWRGGGVAEIRDLVDGSAGFGVWRGRVSAVGKTARGAYLEIENQVFIALDASVVKRLPEGVLGGYMGRHVEFRGWLSDRQGAGKPLKAGYLRWFIRVADEHHLRLSE